MNPKWPADAVERRGITALLPYARNARTHSDQQISQIAASITEFGWTVPVLIDADGVLIAGHGRVLAAQRLGLADVPVMVARGWSKQQIAAYRIADNKLALNAGWDADLLTLELGALQADGFNLALTGFGGDELAGLLDTTEGLTDPDDVPEAPAEPVSVLGDVWRLGRHRLVCGDSTDAGAVGVAINGRRADCVFTSPPYGVGVDYGEYDDTITNLRDMLPRLAVSWADVVVPGGFAVINFGDIVSGREASGAAEPCEYPMAVEYWPAFRSAGWTLWTRRIWQKPHARVHSPWAIKSSRAASDWEHLWVWKRPGKVIKSRGDYSAFGVWDSAGTHGVDVGKAVHGAGMAVSIATRGLETHSNPGQAVYEPFSGSGTTIIAAEMTGRACHAIELAPAYVDVAVLRWQAFTGQQATLEASGETFSQVQAGRAGNLASIKAADEPRAA